MILVIQTVLLVVLLIAVIQIAEDVRKILKKK